MIVNLLTGIFLLFFWAAVVTYLPATFFLILRNPLSHRIEQARRKGIYILGKGSQIQEERRRHQRWIAALYGGCLAVLTGLYLVRAITSGQYGIYPFDILSGVSVILFWFSVLTYLPLAFFLAIKDSLHFKEDGIYLKRTFVLYGLGILLFSLIYAGHWMRARNITTGVGDVAGSLLIMVMASAFLAYLPTLAYLLIKARHRRLTGVRPHVIFVIYSLCFLIFSVTYTVNWVKDWKAGITKSPLSSYWEF